MSFRLLLLPLFLVACGGVETSIDAPVVPQTLATPPAPVECIPLARARPLDLVREPEPSKPVLPPGELERVLRDQTTNIALELTSDTVFCSALGYSASFLKVSVPDLDWLAHFDHRVSALGVPCAAAGACSDTVTPEGLLAANARLSVVPVRVVLTEHLNIDLAAGTCTRQLVEKVTIQLNDRVLRHSVEDEPVAWPFEKCTAVVGL